MSDRFTRWFRPDEYARREIEDEIDSHLSARRDHLVRQGFSEEDARREAIARFGDLDGAKAALMHRARARHRRLAWRERVEQIRQDIRYVFRSLARQPAFTIGTIATLTLGLGVNTAVFRVADQVLFRPPAGVLEPGTVRRVEAMVSFGGAPPSRVTSFSYPDVVRVREHRVFAQLTSYSLPRLQADRDGREIGVSAVDADYFAVLGVTPAAGRFFDRREAQPGSLPGVVVVSMDFWRERLGSQPLDQNPLVTLAGRTFRVIGVTPRGFTGIEADPAHVWQPYGDAQFGQGEINGVVIPWYRLDMMRGLRIIGRPSTEDAANEEQIRQRLTGALMLPDSPFRQRGREGRLSPIVPLGDTARAESVNAMLVRLSGVAIVVLVIASSNVVNLLLARGLRRSREVAIRFAVGASRWRVARLLLAESIVLAAAGAAAAVLCGMWTAEALRRLIFPEARWTADAFDVRTGLFTALLAAGAGLIAGVVPAVQGTAHRLLAGLKDTRTPSGRGGQTRAVLVVVQTALSVALLVGCGLLVQSLHRLNSIDLGFEPSRLVSWSIGRSDLEPPQVEELAARVAAMPSVEGVALASIAPFGAVSNTSIRIPGAVVPVKQDDNANYMAVAPEFFTVMRMRLVKGRLPSAQDVSGAEPVALVNQSMARRYWGEASPFDSCIIASGESCARVIGVVADVTDAPGGAPPPLKFYLSLAQSNQLPRAMVVRTRTDDTGALIAALRTMVPTPRPATIESAATGVHSALHPWRVATILFTALGTVALVLACIGIYSVMSYLVAERMPEMGVRLALGATAAGVMQLVLGKGFRLIALGAGIGSIAAASFGHLLESLLYQVSAREPLVYVGASLFLIALGTLAMLPPAMRAARVDPVETLRAD